MKKILTLVILAALTPLTLTAAIFGADERIPVRDDSPLIDIARSTAVSVLSANYTASTPGKIKLDVESLQGVVCPEMKFATDPSLSYSCTGFLVAPDILVTAGHCGVNVGESRHETETYCQAFSWLFDYRLGKDGKVETENIPVENHYKCKQTIYAVVDPKFPFRDFAIVQLDRPVVGRKPLTLSREGVGLGENLFMLGHPLGVPLKLSTNATVLLNDLTRETFISNLDAFEGNSGSPVLNKKNEVIGLLIGGTPAASLIDDPKGRKCRVYNRCDDKGENCTVSDQSTTIFPGFQRVGSEVQKIQSILEKLEKYQRGEEI